MAVREQVHDMWSSVAPAWAEHAASVDARGAGLAERMLALAGLRPGHRVLELACGPGGLGIAAAARVGPSGEVTLSDVSAGMVATAAGRAAAAGVRNVTARPIDMEAIDAPDASWDAVLCREGLMFAVDPARAAREIARVLRPGGRVVAAVWGPPARNPWLAALLDAVGARIGAPLPPPGIPGPFALAGDGALAGALAAAGLEDVTVEEVPVPLEVPSAAAWWSRGVALAGPLARRLAALPPAVVEAAREDAALAVARYAAEGGGLSIPGLSLVAHARRSSAAISPVP